ncbi:MAG: hypothetical protein Q8R02_08750 [Hyphomonadaceae bacterium]|nr:hypothetical protein [Hyphomonadaceae bacterium]
MAYAIGAKGKSAAARLKQVVAFAPDLQTGCILAEEARLALFLLTMTELWPRETLALSIVKKIQKRFRGAIGDANQDMLVEYLDNRIAYLLRGTNPDSLYDPRGGKTLRGFVYDGSWGDVIRRINTFGRTTSIDADIPQASGERSSDGDDHPGTMHDVVEDKSTPPVGDYAFMRSWFDVVLQARYDMMEAVYVEQELAKLIASCLREMSKEARTLGERRALAESAKYILAFAALDPEFVGTIDLPAGGEIYSVPVRAAIPTDKKKGIKNGSDRTTLLRDHVIKAIGKLLASRNSELTYLLETIERTRAGARRWLVGYLSEPVWRRRIADWAKENEFSKVPEEAPRHLFHFIPFADLRALFPDLPDNST